MKYLITKICAILVLSLMTATLHSADWSVGGPTGVDGVKVFNTLQEAHDDADVMDGDTLYVRGVQGNYGALTLTKRLTIFGPGYFLGDNLETQVSTNWAETGSITFNEGSAGSVLSGMVVIGRVQVNANRIEISRNHISFNPGRDSHLIRIADNVQDTVIKQNYIQNYYDGHFSFRTDTILISDDVLNTKITNNYVSSNSGSWRVIKCPKSSTVTVTNNTLSGTVIIDNTVSFFVNNILRWGSDPTLRSNAEYNICNDTQFPATGHNIQNTDMTQVFVPSGSGDNWLQLRDGSPAVGTGQSGADMGTFGGAEPYVLSGLPPIPAVYFFEEDTGATEPHTFQVKAKAH